MHLKDFLQRTGPESRKNQCSVNEERALVTVVLGSEAADLDSIVSAVLYAYYLFLTEPETNPKALVPIPRADFKLRTEAAYLFRKAGIDQDMLNFTEDINLDSLSGNSSLKLILTDHNKFAFAHKHLNECVVGIIDHHADEHVYPASAKADIRPVGSACTIVAEYFLQNKKDAVDKSVGTLLLGTILLDTVNLDPDAGRVTDIDKNIAEQLISMTGEDRQALFDALQLEKFNVSQLSSYDLLRKDYKEQQLGPVKCGISSVRMSAEEWAAEDTSISECFRNFSEENKLDVLISMNAFTSPEFTRHLGVYAKDPKVKQEMTDFLEASELQLEKIEQISDDDDEGVVFYNQKNLGISRKKLQPLLKDFFEQEFF